MGLTNPDPYSDVWRKAFTEPARASVIAVDSRCRFCTRDEWDRDYTAYERLEIWRRGHMDRQAGYKSFHGDTSHIWRDQIMNEEGEQG